jgi:YHS domain-containing protein
MRVLQSIVVILPLLLAACGDPSSSTGSEPAGPKSYPLETCVVSGKKLGSMGDPIVIVHDGQEIKFCCESCQPKFEKDPAKYLAKLSGGGSAPVDHSGHNY